VSTVNVPPSLPSCLATGTRLRRGGVGAGMTRPVVKTSGLPHPAPVLTSTGQTSNLSKCPTSSVVAL